MVTSEIELCFIWYWKFVYYEVTVSLWVTRICMILSLGNTLAATLFEFCGALKKEPSTILIQNLEY